MVQFEKGIKVQARWKEYLTKKANSHLCRYSSLAGPIKAKVDTLENWYGQPALCCTLSASVEGSTILVSETARNPLRAIDRAVGRMSRRLKLLTLTTH